MERVETLCNKLLEQVSKKVSADELLVTVQMIQSELIHLKNQAPAVSSYGKTSIDIPVFVANKPMVEEPAETVQPEEKIVEVLKVDEAELEAELEEIRKTAETRNQMSSHNKPPMQFDPVEDTPTLTHQRAPAIETRKIEIHETLPVENTASLNDRLKEVKTELSDSLQDSAIKDLRKAIGVNDRFLYINELFRGDEVMYERSIKTINGFTIYPEAEYWIKRELKLKLAWSDSNPVVKQFDHLIRRRFSAI